MISENWRKLRPEEMILVKLSRKKKYHNFIMAILIAMSILIVYGLTADIVLFVLVQFISLKIPNIIMFHTLIAFGLAVFVSLLVFSFKNAFINHIPKSYKVCETTIRDIKRKNMRIIITVMLDTDTGYRPVKFSLPRDMNDSIFVCQNIIILDNKKCFEILDF